jgi:hypothetical protein
MLLSIYTFILSSISFFITPLDAWGSIGHIAVADIAQTNLTYNTYKHITNIISNDNISSVANWADEIRNIPEWHWTEPLHFINTNDWICDYIEKRDCYNQIGEYSYCVDGAIQNYTTLIKNDNNNADYLKFLIHFVGDIHQPLHCGFKSDKGGNTIKVHFNNHLVNLHSLWDTNLISFRIFNDFNNNYNQWLNYLLKLSPQLDCIGCSQFWGNNSAQLACKYSYVNSDGITHIKNGDYINIDYYNRNIDIIEKQIVNAGYKLAELLNHLYQ